MVSKEQKAHLKDMIQWLESWGRGQNPFTTLLRPPSFPRPPPPPLQYRENNFQLISNIYTCVIDHIPYIVGVILL